MYVDKAPHGADGAWVGGIGGQVRGKEPGPHSLYHRILLEDS